MVCSKSQSVKLVVDEDIVGEGRLRELIEESTQCENYNAIVAAVEQTARLALDIYLAVVLKRYAEEINPGDDFTRAEIGN